MSKIVFFCIPAFGHTNPTLNVVKELIAGGHQVWYYSYNLLKDKIEATGATFISCDEYDEELKLSPKDATRVGKDLALSTRVLVDTTLSLNDKVCEDMQKLKPDCIVADSMAVWGKAVAMKLGIPFVSSTTTFAFNKHSAQIMKKSIGEMLGMIFSMSKINKDIKRLQDKGFPINNILDILQNDDNTHTIVYTSSEFQPCADTFSDKFAFVGPSVRPATDEIKKTKDKLLYISMGTVVNDMPLFYKNCVSAFKDTDYQVIMSVGNLTDIEKLGELPANISVHKHIDQIAVLQKADVFISHCGMNSVNESLYFGVPLVMLPQTSEQGGVAQRVLQLGAGTILKKAKANSIIEAVNNVINEKSYKENADKIANSFKNCSGAKGAVEKILEVCNAKI